MKIKSTFGKTFIYYIIVLLVSTFLLSLGFTGIFREYFYSEQKNDLLNQAMKISDIYTQSYVNEVFDEYYFESEIAILDKYMDYSFFMTDKNLNVIAESKDILNESVKNKISPFPEYDDILNGKIRWIKGNIDDVYSQSRYILCYPIIHNNMVESIVFVSVPLSELIENINRMYIIVAFFLLLAFILGFVTINLVVSEFVKPVRELNSAAKYISKGNFEEKIEIRNNTNDELKELCHTFNKMAENLESLEKRRREIISNISHDLRSPITSIRGFLQAMLDGTIREDKYKHYMEIIYKETERLQILSDNILDLTKLDNSVNALNITEFDINSVINEVINLIKVRADEKNIYLKMVTESERISVKGDIEKIRRVINNLVDNAVKFTEKGGIIVCSKIKDGKAYISVEDTGIGLSDEEQTRVFERLYKADASRGMDKTGSGLGLAIVKEFVKAHKQTIELESEKGKGSKFTFTLDLA